MENISTAERVGYGLLGAAIVSSAVLAVLGLRFPGEDFANFIEHGTIEEAGLSYWASIPALTMAAYYGGHMMSSAAAGAKPGLIGLSRINVRP